MTTRIIYPPDNSNRKFFSVWFAMLTELMARRDLIWQLIYRDISVRYRQSVLGYIWAVVPQLVTVLIFSFLAKNRVFAMGQPPMPYILYALWNISIWQLFAACLLNSTESLVKAGTLVTKNNFPKETLILSAIGQPVVDFIIRLVPCAVVVLIMGFKISYGIVFVPIILLMMIFLALGIGFVLSIANLVIRDISNALSVLLMFGVFLAPILYPPPVREPYYLVNILNPFSPLLIATQDLIVSGVVSNLPLVLLYSAGSFFVFLSGWYVFHISLKRVIEKA